jgi:hypothetical protein
LNINKSILSFLSVNKDLAFIGLENEFIKIYNGGPNGELVSVSIE